MKIICRSVFIVTLLLMLTLQGWCEEEDFSLDGIEDLFSDFIEADDAHDFTLEGLKEGTSIHLADYKGKVVILDFWATWCPPCRRELPILQKIYEEYNDKDKNKNKGFVFIAVNSREDRDAVQRYIEKEGFTFPVALDNDGKVGDLYKVEAYPTMVLIDKKGKIFKTVVGLEHRKAIEKSLNKLLEKE